MASSLFKKQVSHLSLSKIISFYASHIVCYNPNNAMVATHNATFISRISNSKSVGNLTVQTDEERKLTEMRYLRIFCLM